MKNYMKSYMPGGILSASKSAPIYFAVMTEDGLYDNDDEDVDYDDGDLDHDLEVGDEVALVHAHNGKYLGWCTLDDMRRYIYGQLYYRANRRYRIKTQDTREYDSVKLVIEKATNKLALCFCVKTMEERDFYDESKKVDTYKRILQALKDEQDEEPYEAGTELYPTDFKDLVQTADDEGETAVPEEFKDIIQRFEDETNHMIIRHHKEFTKHVKSLLEQERLIVEVAQLKVPAVAKKAPVRSLKF